MTEPTWRDAFGRFLGANPHLLHFAAHSHHLWPDVTFAAHQQAWLDAAARVDEKWGGIMGAVLPTARGHVARLLGLDDPGTVVFAPNTHELVVRLVSCIGQRPVRVLTTDGEFHSFARQVSRWQEADEVEVTRVACAPYDDFAARFLAAAARGGHDLVYISQVFFDSGLVFERFADLSAAVPAADTVIVVDGYHGFMARPTDLSAVADRIFYLGGGYKYAMAGEGACFMHCPPGQGRRPVNTGWFAGFGDLDKPRDAQTVAYARDGHRFFGSTFDASGIYRFNAALGFWHEQGVSVADIHDHVVALQERFLDAAEAGRAGPLAVGELLPPRSIAERGHFLTFRRPDAVALHARLREADVLTDVRGDRLRFGFGVYHRDVEVDALLDRLAAL